MTIDPTTVSPGIQIVLSEFERRGIDPAPLLAKCGLEGTDATPEGRVRPEALGRFLEAASATLGDPFIGVTIASRTDPLELGPIGFVAATSATPHEALVNFRRYLPLISNADAIELSANAKTVKIAGITGSPEAERYRQLTESGTYFLIHLCQNLSGKRLLPLEVRLPYEADKKSNRYTDAFGCPVTFGHLRTQIVYDRAKLQAPLKCADRRLNAVLKSYCETLLAEAEESGSTFVNRLKEEIIDQLPRQGATARSCALMLGLSERSLQRKLGELGTSFVEQRDQVRKDLAYRYLAQSDESLSNIASMLGYASQSSFNTSFKRMTNKTPSEVRKHA